MRFSYITRNIFYLSLISFFTDVASEMLYPVIPLYLSAIGISVSGIGIIEGIAETLSALSKTYFGIMSDRLKKRKIFIIIGYGLSTVSKPFMIVFSNYFWILFMRLSDRLGKGIRTAPRDALLSDESVESNKGKVFGFHRSIDTLGAAVGPAITLILLSFYHWHYTELFILAIIPGILTIIISLFIKEKKQHHFSFRKIKWQDLLAYWKISSYSYKIVTVLLILFYIFNSSDMLLLLKAQTHSSVQDSQVILLYIIYNISYALFAFPFGIIGDKIGLRNTIAIGLLFFGVTYIGITYFESWEALISLFILYGIYSAAIEGNIKALLSNLSEKEYTATAIGLFTTLQSFTFIISNSLAGFLWENFNSSLPFILSGCVSILVSILLILIPLKR
ncbi:MAG: MFS transporter [Bacteroidota bacterium]